MYIVHLYISVCYVHCIHIYIFLSVMYIVHLYISVCYVHYVHIYISVCYVHCTYTYFCLLCTLYINIYFSVMYIVHVPKSSQPAISQPIFFVRKTFVLIVRENSKVLANSFSTVLQYLLCTLCTLIINLACRIPAPKSKAAPTKVWRSEYAPVELLK